MSPQGSEVAFIPPERISHFSDPVATPPRARQASPLWSHPPRGYFDHNHGKRHGWNGSRKRCQTLPARPSFARSCRSLRSVVHNPLELQMMSLRPGAENPTPRHYVVPTGDYCGLGQTAPMPQPRDFPTVGNCLQVIDVGPFVPESPHTTCSDTATRHHGHHFRGGSQLGRGCDGAV
jgi:hypothetical protein